MKQRKGSFGFADKEVKNALRDKVITLIQKINYSEKVFKRLVLLNTF